jgi:hypothetical protein
MQLNVRVKSREELEREAWIDDVNRARDLPGLLELLKERFEQNAPGLPSEWILSTTDVDLRYLCRTIGNVDTGHDLLSASRILRRRDAVERRDWARAQKMIREAKLKSPTRFVWLLLLSANDITFRRGSKQQAPSKADADWLKM